MGTLSGSLMVLAAFLLQWSLSPATSATFHIVTSPAAPCPGEFIGEPCLTLQQYVSNPSISNGNITLLFETGTHYISHAFSPSNAHSYTLSGYNTSIQCTSNTVTFALTSIHYLNINGLNFSNCGCPCLRLSSVDNVSVADSSFTNNRYYYCSGSAIYLYNSVLNLYRSIFMNNVASNFGGAIYARSSRLSIRESLFKNNYATNFNGGAIWANYSIVILQECSFIQNNAGYKGGAIYIENSPLIMVNTIFRNNRASKYEGGGLYYTGNNITINNSTFVGNRAGTSGGGVHIGDTNTTSVNSSVFMENTANSGGAMSSMSILILCKTYFANNIARRCGGGIYVNSTTNISILTAKCTFVNNTAITEGGGAIYFNSHYSNVSLISSRFSYNSASYCSVLDVDKYYHFSVNLIDSVFTHNTATGQLIGGGVACIRNASINIVRSTFKHNYADLHGGVFYIDKSVTSVAGSLFVNNSAAMDGGVFYTDVHACSYNIKRSQFTNNSAGDDGGVLFIFFGRVNIRVSIDESTFSWNDASDRGGVVAIIASSMFIEINRTNIFNNTASFGGIISACNSEVTVLEQELFVSEDPVYSSCTLYDGDVTHFNIISPRDLEETIPTTSDVPQLSSVTSESSLPTPMSKPNIMSTSQYTSTVETTSTTFMSAINLMSSLSASNTELVESLPSSEKLTPDISPTATSEVFTVSSSLSSHEITTKQLHVITYTEAPQYSPTSSFDSRPSSIAMDINVNSSITDNELALSSSQSPNLQRSKMVTSVPSSSLDNLVTISSITLNTKSLSSLPAITMSSVTESDKNDIKPILYRVPYIINNNYYNNNNSLQLLMCFLFMFVLSITIIYICIKEGKFRSAFKFSQNSTNLKYGAENYSKKCDTEDLSEKEEIF